MTQAALLTQVPAQDQSTTAPRLCVPAAIAQTLEDALQNASAYVNAFSGEPDFNCKQLRTNVCAALRTLYDLRPATVTAQSGDSLFTPGEIAEMKHAMEKILVTSQVIMNGDASRLPFPLSSMLVASDDALGIARSAPRVHEPKADLPAVLKSALSRLLPGLNRPDPPKPRRPGM